MNQKKFQAGLAFTTVILLLIGLSIACGGGSSESDLKGKVGEKIKTDKFEITVSSVTPRNSVGGEFINQKRGQVPFLL
jgi:hypothetical protein